MNCRRQSQVDGLRVWTAGLEKGVVVDSTPDGAAASIAAVSAQTRQEHVPGLVRDSFTDDGLGELFL